MNLQGFDKIATNIEILQYIYELLSFEEQLKLATVSTQLEYVFKNFIWKVNHEKICIIKNPPNFYIRNDTEMNNLNLNQKEFKEFINLYASEVRELKEFCDPVLDIRKFPNLTSLSYNNMSITKNQLQLVAKSCLKLEKLHIYTCINKARDMLEIGKDVEIRTLLEMKNLKYLSFESAMQTAIKYRYFRDLVTKSKIKHLELKCYIETDKQISVFDNRRSNSLNELEISTTFQAKYWLKNFPYYLKHFENLQSLTLNDADIINNHVVITLANTCKKLQKLFINFTTFEKVTNFSLLKTLTELSLQMCSGLSHDNLKQILTELKLTKFCSLQTKYSGKFENFPISSTVKSLDLHDFKTHEFKSAYDHNENIIELTWYDDYYNPKTTGLTISCPNIETLNISSGIVSLENLLELTSLRKLILPQSMPNLNWSYISTLLQHHPSLSDLTFDGWGSPRDLKASGDIPHEAFKCAGNFKYLTVAVDLFELSADFWLDLYCKNPNIKLVCLGHFTNEFVKTLIKSRKFPRNLKSLQIWGFKVGFDDLRRNFDETMNKLNTNTHLPINACSQHQNLIVF